MSDVQEYATNDLSDADRLEADLRNAVTIVDVHVQLIRRRSAGGAIIPDWLLDSLVCLEDATNRLRIFADRLTK